MDNPLTIDKFHVRHLYPSNGGNHLSMSRVLNDQCLTDTRPKNILSSI